MKSFSLTSSAAEPPATAARRSGGREPDDGAQHGPRAAQADEEREHAPRVGQRAVEVEGGDGRARPAAARPSVGVGQSSAAPPRPAPPANRTRSGQRLAAADDVAPAPGLVRRRPPPRSGPTAPARSCGRSAGRPGAARPAGGPAPRRPASASPGGDDAVGQPHGQRLGRRHGAAGQDQVHGPAVADDAGEAHRAEVAQRHAEAPAEHAEDGVLGRHPQVAPEGQLDARRPRRSPRRRR